MERQGDEVHIETDEARGGSTPHIVRYVLVISLIMAIIALSLIWITGAVSRDTYPDPVPSAEATAAPTGG
jgi:hypothetical protein